MIFGKVWKTAVANLWKSLKIFVLAKEFDEVFKTEEKLSNPLKQNAFPVLDLLEKVTDFKDIIAIEGTLDGNFYIFSNPIVMYRNIPVDIGAERIRTR